MAGKYKHLESSIEAEQEVENLYEELLATITNTYDSYILEDSKIEDKIYGLAKLVIKESRKAQQQEEDNQQQEEDDYLDDHSEEDPYSDNDFYSPEHDE